MVDGVKLVLLTFEVSAAYEPMRLGTSFNSLTRFAANGWDVYQGWGLGAERSLGNAEAGEAKPQRCVSSAQAMLCHQAWGQPRTRFR